MSFWFDEDGLNEECGVFGIFNHPDAAELTYYGMHALQHRGQESAGICVSDEGVLNVRRGMGLVTEALNKQTLETLPGCHAIGHVRYTTAGASIITNAQPLRFRYTGGQVAIAHNGNLVNAQKLRGDLERRGSIFQTDSDTEVISHLMAQSGLSVEKALQTALVAIEGAYALVLLTPEKLIVAQDPRGFRPLCLGQIGQNCWVIASESCAFNVIDADLCGTYIRVKCSLLMSKVPTPPVLLQNYPEPSAPSNTSISPDPTVTLGELVSILPESNLEQNSSKNLLQKLILSSAFLTVVFQQQLAMQRLQGYRTR